MIGRGGLGLLARDIVALTPSYLIPGLASLVAVPVLFSLLGPSGYGLWALIFGIANGVPQLTTSWLESLILRFGHRPGHGMGASFYVAAGAASAVGGALLAAVFIPGADLRVVGSTAILTLGVGAYLIIAARLQSELAFLDVSRVAALRSVGGVVLSVILAALTHDATAAAIGLAGGFGLGTVAGLARARRQRADPATPAADMNAADAPPAPMAKAPRGTGVAGELVSYGLASGLFAVGLFVLSVGDRFVLSAVRPLADVGVYAATYTIVDLAFRLAPSIVVTTVRQRLFRAWDLGDRERAVGLLAAGIALISWLSAWLIEVIVLAGPAVTVLPLDRGLVGPIAAGLAFFVVANVLVILYSAQVRQPRAAVHVVIAAAFNVGLNVVLDPAMGAGGAALATALGYAAYLGLNAIGLLDVVRALQLPGGVAIIAGALTAIAGVLHPTLGAGPLVAAAIGLLVTLPAVVAVTRSSISLSRRGS